MQKLLSISQSLNTSVLLQYLFICLSITSACMQRVIFLSNSSLSIPCQIKYPGTRNHTYFVHRSLLHQGTSVVKLKRWYFLLVLRNFHYESVLAVIMPDRNGNSVANIAVADIAVARVEFSEPV